MAPYLYRLCQKISRKILSGCGGYSVGVICGFDAS